MAFLNETGLERLWNHIVAKITSATSNFQTQLDDKMDNKITYIKLNEDGSLADYGGYINFYHNGNASYTSRIIEETSGQLTIYDSQGGKGGIAGTRTSVATLATGSWSNLTQSVNVGSFLRASSIVIVTPAPNSQSAYSEAGVYCSAQTDGSLTFTCTETPTEDLTVNLLILTYY